MESEGRGVLIALEGIDGAGTTTQARLVCRWLEDRGLRPLLTREPSDGPVGQLVRKALAGEPALDDEALALLFAADRLDHLAREIRPALDQGRPVICDRFILSSYAYQGVLGLGWVREINGRALWPHLTLLLEVDPALALERIACREDQPQIYESLGFLQAVARAYGELARDHEGVVVIDGGQGVERVFEEVAHAVTRVLSGVEKP